MKRDRSGDPPKSAAELMADLQRDPAFLAREHERKGKQGEAVSEYRQAASELLKELSAEGFSVETVGELRHRQIEYQRAIPLLLRWLPRVSNPHVKEDIVRTLSVPWARPTAARALLEEFERPDAPAPLKWAIGNGLEVVADGSVVPDLLRIVRERRHGKAREMVVLALANAKGHAGVIETLIDLLDDSEVAVQATIALGKLGAAAARPHLEAVSKSAKGLLKKEAKRALEKL